MHEDGASYQEIADCLDVTAWRTIRYWVDSEFREYKKEKSLHYYSLNKEKGRKKKNAYNRTLYRANSKKIKINGHNYYMENEDSIKKRQAMYYSEHKEEYDERNRNRRSIVRSYKPITKTQYNLIYEEQEGRCFYCGKPMTRDGDWHAADYYNVEHINSLSNGGWHTIENIVYACHGCNCEKHTALVEDWMPSILQKIEANPRLRYDIEEAHMRWLV